MKPILVELKLMIGDKATILKIDMDKNPSLSARYQIQGVPTLAIFKRGIIVWRQSGVVSASQLQTILNKHIDSV